MHPSPPHPCVRHFSWCCALRAQVTLRLNATATAASAGNAAAASAVTDTSAIAGAILIAADEANMDYGAAQVEVVVECGDGVCSPGEPKVKGQDDTSLTCTADCAFMIGECDAPPASGVGDSTLQCGGKGMCNPANLLCDCYVGYAVRLSSFCLTPHAQKHIEQQSAAPAFCTWQRLGLCVHMSDITVC